MDTTTVRPGPAGSKIVGGAVFAASAVLLLSMGGAVVAAPVTVPLLVLVARAHRTTAVRVAAAVLVAATVGELVWAATYVLAGEAQPWIWALPLGSAVAGALVTARLSSPAGRSVRPGRG